MGVAILTYHSMRISGNGYAQNDLVAFASDLVTITRLGLRIVPLPLLVAEWLSTGGLPRGVVALTCDDGPDFDWEDLPHPTAGPQRSLFHRIADFMATGRGFSQPQVHLTSFVIASPEARARLDRACMVGRGWWSHAWWPAAVATGRMAIGNHSWDHNHHLLPEDARAGGRRGTFFSVDSESAADFQIRQSCEFIRGVAPNPGESLFAYPYGQAPAFVAGEYLPRHGRALGIAAAFTDAPGTLTPSTDRWRIPRFVCGRDWHDASELRRLLRQATQGPSIPVGGSPPVARPSAPRPGGAGDVFLVLEAPTADAAAPLFRRKFGAMPPAFPHHFLAVARRGGRISGYVHYTSRPGGVYLCGGLCVDTAAYRGLTKEERAAVSSAGSLSRYLLDASMARLPGARAVFAYTGNVMSVRDVLRLGYERTEHRHLFVRWSRPETRDERLVQAVADLGPF